jgi:2-dehydro-3-deoxyphosphogluconate aldolase/(4S)-4-hydroxy-2-oxoglutarate aldolase
VSAVTSPIDVHGVVAIIRLARIDDPEAMVEALAAGGIRYVEFTLSSEGALEAIRRSVELAVPGVVIGAGTVTSVQDVIDVSAAGGAFCISPNTDVRIIRACLDADLIPVPGAFTPSEVFQAMEAGARAVKLFPAGVVGPSLVKAIRGPIPDAQLIATGAIRLEESGAYRRAGAVGVGIGSDLIDEGWTPQALTAAAERAVASWSEG